MELSSDPATRCEYRATCERPQRRIVWSEKFDQTFTDIFGIQDTISDRVVRSLALNLTAAEQKQLAKRYTTNAAAYYEYLMGLYFWNTRSRDGLEKAIDHFGRAVEKDPNFALAYALMADCYYLQFYYGYDHPTGSVQMRMRQSNALLLDDTIAEAYVAAAMVQFYQRDDERAMDPSTRYRLKSQFGCRSPALRLDVVCVWARMILCERWGALRARPALAHQQHSSGVSLVFARQYREG